MTFRAFARNFKSLWGMALVSVLAGPITLDHIGFGPPWPPFVTQYAILACVIALMMSFAVVQIIQHILRANKRSKNVFYETSFMILGILALVFAAGSIVYYTQAWYSTIVVIATDKHVSDKVIVTRRNYIVGTVRKPGVSKEKSNELLLREGGLDPTRYWTDKSIESAHYSILLSYIMIFFFLTFGVSLIAYKSPPRITRQHNKSE